MKVFESKALSIFDSGTALRIPFFQRQYVWDVAQWRKFVEDVQYVARYNYPFFLGSIIRKKEDVTVKGASDQFSIIDGQQRLTTIVLFMKALQEARNDNQAFRNLFIIADLDLPQEQCSTPILQHNAYDLAAFNAICNGSIVTSESQIAKAYDYFRRFLTHSAREQEDNLAADITLNQLYNALRSRVNLVDIQLDADDQEQQIFDTINSAGCDLTTGQLLKNYFFNQQHEQLYVTRWKPRFDLTESLSKFWSSQITSGKTSDVHIEQFCYAFMQIKIASGSVAGLKEADKKEFRHRNAGMFRNYKLLVERYKLDKEAFINEFVDYADLYYGNFSEDIEKCDIPQQAGMLRLFCIMKATNTWTPMPFLLYVLHEQKDQEELTAIFAYLEKYLLHRLICKRSNNNYSDFFSENLIGQRITTSAALEAYVAAKDANDSLSMPTDDELLEAVKTNDLSGNTAKVILYMTESALTKSTQFPSYSAFVAAPLIPKSSKSGDIPAGWDLEDGYTAENRSALCNTLGNWAILNSDKTVSKTIQTMQWLIKYVKYHPMLTAAAVTNESISPTVMTDSTVEARSVEMLELYKIYWLNEEDADEVAAEEQAEEVDAEFEDSDAQETDMEAAKQESAAVAAVQAEDLPDVLDNTIWSYYVSKEYRHKFRIYMLASGMAIAEVNNAVDHFRIYLSRIKGAFQPARYNATKDVKEFKAFLDEVEQAWLGRNKYTDAPALCINYLDFLRRCAANQVNHDVKVKQREILHVTLVDPDGNEHPNLELMDALEMLVLALGEKYVLKNQDKLRLKNKPLLVKPDSPEGAKYRQLQSGNRLNNLGSPKDKLKMLKTILIHLKTWELKG